MKWQRALFFALTVVVGIPSYLQGSYYRCDVEEKIYARPYRGYTGGVECIYWRPTYEIPFAAKGYIEGEYNYNFELLQPKARQHYIHTDYMPGVRAYVGVDDFLCDFDLLASYTFLYTWESTGISGLAGTIRDPLWNPGLPCQIVSAENQMDFSALNFLDQIRSVHQYDYHAIDLMLVGDYCCSPDSTLRPFFGPTGLYVESRMRQNPGMSLFSFSELAFVQAELNSKIKTQYWGVGLKLGTTYTYRLTNYFDFYTTGDVALLLGNAQDHAYFDFNSRIVTILPITETTNEERLIVRGENRCISVPGWHLSLGVRLHDYWCHKEIEMRVGYEIVQWHGLPLPHS